mgnify:FL=1
MTMYGLDSPDSEDFVVSWLQVQARASTERDTDDELPFAVVTRIAGVDDPDGGSSEDSVQVEWFDRGASAASFTARRGHRRMMLLAREQTDVTLSDDTVASIDYLKTTMRPTRMPYADEQIIRYVARYRIGLSFVDS